MYTLGSTVCTLSATNLYNSPTYIWMINFYLSAENPRSVDLCHFEIINYWTEIISNTLSWQDALKEFIGVENIRSKGNIHINVA